MIQLCVNPSTTEVDRDRRFGPRPPSYSTIWLPCDQHFYRKIIGDPAVFRSALARVFGKGLFFSLRSLRTAPAAVTPDAVSEARSSSVSCTRAALRRLRFWSSKQREEGCFRPAIA
jgi:hypothetical protein